MITVFWLFAVTWAIETRTVTTGSMAPAFDGVHRLIECQDCRFRFPCGMDPPPPLGGRAVCPNCGFAANEVGKFPDVAGDGLLVNKAAFLGRPPRRWEVVAFRNPAHPSQVALKRVLGLPGETCEFQNGDLFINDKAVQKSLDQLRALRVLVYDDRFPSTNKSLPRRFVPDENWRISDGVYLHEPGDANEVTAIHYRHWRRAPGDPNKAQPAPVDDNYGYDPFRSRRVEDMHAVPDLMVTCKLRASGPGDVMVRMNDGRGELLALLGPAHGRALLFVSDGDDLSPIHDVTITTDLLSTDTRLEAAMCDGRFLMAIDGQVLFPPTPYFETESPSSRSTNEPISLGVSNGDLTLRIWDLKVWRDLYYEAPPGPGPHWGSGQPCRLKADEYFVVGDNVPVSEDSRSWPNGPGLRANLLVGKPFLVYFPHRRTNWGVQLQVPRWEKIRYIP